MEFSLSIYRSDKMEIIEFMKKGDLYEIAKKHKKIHRMPLSKLSKPELEKIVLDLSKHEQVGSGIIEDFKNFGKKLVDKAKQIFFFPPNKLPVSSEKVFNVYKGETITGIEVRREPLTGAISKVADWVSGGKYTEKLKDLGYDKVFHLYMILKFGNRKVLIEKNERINITTKIAKNPDSDSIEVPLNGQKNLDDFLNIARDKMGDHAFFQYNARDNNCQDFLLGILKANDLLNPDIEKFIKQDAKEIFESLPSWSSALAQFVTDTGGKINQVINGGKKKIKKVKKKVERKGL